MNADMNVDVCGAPTPVATAPTITELSYSPSSDKHTALDESHRRQPVQSILNDEGVMANTGSAKVWRYQSLDPSDLSDVLSDDGNSSKRNHKPEEDTLSSVGSSASGKDHQGDGNNDDDGEGSDDGANHSLHARVGTPSVNSSAHHTSDLNIDLLSSSSLAGSDNRKPSAPSSSSSSATSYSRYNSQTRIQLRHTQSSLSLSPECRNKTTTPTSQRRGRLPLSGRTSRNISPQRTSASATSVRPRKYGTDQTSTKPAHDIDRRDRSGRSRLFKAAVKGQTELVKELIQTGANLNMKDNAGWTSLHEAVTEKQVAVVEILLKAGANPNMQGLGGDTPLHDAVDVEHLELVRLLLRYGATPFIRNDNNHEPLHNAERCSISGSNHTNVCQLPAIRDVIVFYCRLEDALHRRDTYGMTLLHRLCLENKRDMVQELVECRKVDVHTADNAGWTPLHEAALEGHYEVADILLVNGADANAQSQSGDTPLHDASSQDHVDMAKLLLTYGANPLYVNGQGETPISLTQNTAIVDLFQRAKDDGAIVDMQRHQSHKRICVDPSARNIHKRDGYSISANANSNNDINYNNDSIISPSISRFDSHKTLTTNRKELDQDQDMISPEQQFAESVISGHSGASEWNEDTKRPSKMNREERKLMQIVQSIERLEQQGKRRRAKRNADDDGAGDQGNDNKERNTSTGKDKEKTVSRKSTIVPPREPKAKQAPLLPRQSSSTAFNESQSQQESLTRSRPRDNIRLDVRSRDSGGRTPLQRFAKKGDAVVIRTLINDGAEVNVQDHAGWSPLHEACLGGHLAVAQLLIRHGAQVNIQALNKETPLHDAVENGHTEVIRYLIRHGADPFIKDERSMSPIGLARSRDDGGELERSVMKESKRYYRNLTTTRKSARERKRVIEDDVSETEHDTDIGEKGKVKKKKVTPVSVKKQRYQRRVEEPPLPAVSAEDSAMSDKEIKFDYDVQMSPHTLVTNGSSTTDELQKTNVKLISSEITSKNSTHCQQLKNLSDGQKIDDARVLGTPVLSLTIQATISHHLPALMPSPTSLLSSETFCTTLPVTGKTSQTHAPLRAPVNPAKFLPLLSIQIPPSICYYVIDVQVLLLLGLSSQHILYERYPHLSHRSASHQEKSFLRPLSEHIMPVLQSYYQPQQQQSSVNSDKITSVAETLTSQTFSPLAPLPLVRKKQLAEIPITFLVLDEILAVIRKDYPDLLEILRTHMFDFPAQTLLTSTPSISSFTSIPTLRPPRLRPEDTHLLPPKLAYKVLQHSQR